MLINLEKVNIPNSVVEELEKIFKNFTEIKKIVLFGSRARKDNKESSDIDLAVYGIRENKIKFIDMIEEINTLYSFDLVFDCDVVSEKLLFEIKKEGCVIYE